MEKYISKTTMRILTFTFFSSLISIGMDQFSCSANSPAQIETRNITSNLPETFQTPNNLLPSLQPSYLMIIRGKAGISKQENLVSRVQTDYHCAYTN